MIESRTAPESQPSRYEPVTSHAHTPQLLVKREGHRVWDGATRDVLIEQDYGGDPQWRMHFDYLLPFFSDRRHLKYQGKPMFLVYRPQDFPAISQMFAAWQRWAQEASAR